MKKRERRQATIMRVLAEVLSTPPLEISGSPSFVEASSSKFLWHDFTAIATSDCSADAVGVFGQVAAATSRIRSRLSGKANKYGISIRGFASPVHLNRFASSLLGGSGLFASSPN